MWPVRPRPSSCRSMPPASSMRRSYSSQCLSRAPPPASGRPRAQAPHDRPAKASTASTQAYTAHALQPGASLQAAGRAARSPATSCAWSAVLRGRSSPAQAAGIRARRLPGYVARWHAAVRHMRVVRQNVDVVKEVRLRCAGVRLRPPQGQQQAGQEVSLAAKASARLHEPPVALQRVWLRRRRRASAQGSRGAAMAAERGRAHHEADVLVEVEGHHVPEGEPLLPVGLHQEAVDLCWRGACREAQHAGTACATSVIGLQCSMAHVQCPLSLPALLADTADGERPQRHSLQRSQPLVLLQERICPHTCFYSACRSSPACAFSSTADTMTAATAAETSAASGNAATRTRSCACSASPSSGIASAAAWHYFAALWMCRVSSTSKRGGIHAR